VPDALAHYVASYLVARAVLRPRYAALLALVGLLPDLDALLGIHRWVTHSLPVALAVALPVLAATYVARGRYLGTATLALALYSLHLALDTLTSPTPVLWPLAPSVWVRVGVGGRVGPGGVLVDVALATVTKPADFSRRAYVEGPIVSEVGLVLAVVALAVEVAEHIAGRRKA